MDFVGVSFLVINMKLFVHWLLAACKPGQYRDVSENICKLCPVGSYQPLKWQEDCINCDPDYSTLGQGSVKRSDCLSKFSYCCILFVCYFK